jgi:hypothetical protein
LWVVIWLAVALASLIVILTAILSIPFEIHSHIEVYEKPEFRIRLKWLFGLFKKDIRAKKELPKKKEAPKKKEKEKLGEGRKWLWAASRIIRIKGIPSELLHLVKGILNSFKIKVLRVDFKVGLDDPADTAFLVGIINASRLFWKPSFTHEIDIRPDYEGEVFLEGYTHLTVRVLPIQIVVSVLSFLFSWSTLKAMRILVVTKWKK